MFATSHIGSSPSTMVTRNRKRAVSDMHAATDEESRSTSSRRSSFDVEHLTLSCPISSQFNKKLLSKAAEELFAAGERRETDESELAPVCVFSSVGALPHEFPTRFPQCKVKWALVDGKFFITSVSCGDAHSSGVAEIYAQAGHWLRATGLINFVRDMCDGITTIGNQKCAPDYVFIPVRLHEPLPYSRGMFLFLFIILFQYLI